MSVKLPKHSGAPIGGAGGKIQAVTPAPAEPAAGGAEEVGQGAARFASQMRGRAPTVAEQRSSAARSIGMTLSGLAGMIAKGAEPSQIDKRADAVLAEIDEALPNLASLAQLDDKAFAKLGEGLEKATDAVGPYLSELLGELKQAQAAEDHALASAIDRFGARLDAIRRFADAALTTPQHGAQVVGLADGVGGGLLPARAGLEIAHSIDVIATSTGLAPAEVAEAFAWYMGRMTEVGFREPSRFYEALEAQAEGQPPAVGLPIRADDVTRRALYAQGLLAEVADLTKPKSAEAYIQAIDASIEVRTSDSHPIQVAWVPTNTPGKLGVTLAPGKSQPSLFRYIWKRDLDTDLDQLRKEQGVDVLVPLIEDHELKSLEIPDLVGKAEARGMEVRRLPIVDQRTPDPARSDALADEILAKLQGGKNVLVHCKGGLGRAGTIAALTLIKLGVPPDQAMSQVREVRPGAIENKDQETFIHAFAAGTLPGLD